MHADQDFHSPHHDDQIAHRLDVGQQNAGNAHQRYQDKQDKRCVSVWWRSPPTDPLAELLGLDSVEKIRIERCVWVTGVFAGRSGRA